jgi:hypothetical protein
VDSLNGVATLCLSLPQNFSKIGKSCVAEMHPGSGSKLIAFTFPGVARDQMIDISTEGNWLAGRSALAEAPCKRRSVEAHREDAGFIG